LGCQCPLCQLSNAPWNINHHEPKEKWAIQKLIKAAGLFLTNAGKKAHKGIIELPHCRHIEPA